MFCRAHFNSAHGDCIWSITNKKDCCVKTIKKDKLSFSKRDKGTNRYCLESNFTNNDIPWRIKYDTIPPNHTVNVFYDNCLVHRAEALRTAKAWVKRQYLSNIK